MKRQLALASAVALCACGFSPMYSDSRVAGAEAVFVEPISGTSGIDLRNALHVRMGGRNDAAGAKYALSVDLQNPDNIYHGLQTTGDATWQEVRMTAHYRLSEKATGETILTGAEAASESYTFVRDLVAAKASQTNAVQNTIRLLADKISMRVSAKVGE
jgi:hypothetical protein